MTTEQYIGLGLLGVVALIFIKSGIKFYINKHAEH